MALVLPFFLCNFIRGRGFFSFCFRWFFSFFYCGCFFMKKELKDFCF
ncbi:hypothetical protein FTV88_1144 [Heliorestis convoluta]|uniref:Uncharacterized protein n=1 Tax=Heliorestis convoluta TaxID=356322 RepID=A0A5Q2MZ51_9FIRM|nr:hypothetical protein FTV88_1144 [Heliorestis convoluta]